MELAEATDYLKLQGWLDDYCANRNSDRKCWHNYGPAEIGIYRRDPVKVLLMGSEAWGYDEPRIPASEYLKWIAGTKHSNPTPLYGAVLVQAIRENIANLQAGTPVANFSRESFVKSRQDRTRLAEDMVGAIYMNARVTSHYSKTGDTREERDVIAREVVEFAGYRRQFFQVLKPRIVICAGKWAKSALFIDGGPFPPAALKPHDPVFFADETVIVQVKRLSYPARFGGYRGLHELAKLCADKYVAQTWGDQ